MVRSEETKVHYTPPASFLLSVVVVFCLLFVDVGSKQKWVSLQKLFVVYCFYLLLLFLESNKSVPDSSFVCRLSLLLLFVVVC